jgi:hypothetical protein
LRPFEGEFGGAPIKVITEDFLTVLAIHAIECQILNCRWADERGVVLRGETPCSSHIVWCDNAVNHTIGRRPAPEPPRRNRHTLTLASRRTGKYNDPVVDVGFLPLCRP